MGSFAKIKHAKISEFTVCKIFKRKDVNIFLSISFYICFGCSVESSHCFGLEIKKIILTLL